MHISGVYESWIDGTSGRWRSSRPADGRRNQFGQPKESLKATPINLSIQAPSLKKSTNNLSFLYPIPVLSSLFVVVVIVVVQYNLARYSVKY
jgi:hypothetical protein